MSREYLKQKIWDAPEIAIVELSAEIWKHYGYKAEIRPKSSGEGVDIIATRSHPYQRREVIHVAHTQDEPVESSVVQRVSALAMQEDADSVILVTTGSVEEDTLSLATDLDVKVVDGDQLCSMIHSVDLYSTLAKAIDLKDSRDQRIHLETLVDRIVANTAIEAKRPLLEKLRTYFENHTSVVAVDQQPTLATFSEGEIPGEWEHSTTMRLSSNPELDADSVANHLMKELTREEVASVETSVISSVIRLELEEKVGEPLETASASELAEWLINDFDDVRVPLVAEDSGLAVEIAEDSIKTEESVVSNKLRVAERLNRRYEESFNHN